MHFEFYLFQNPRIFDTAKHYSSPQDCLALPLDAQGTPHCLPVVADTSIPLPTPKGRPPTEHTGSPCFNMTSIRFEMKSGDDIWTTFTL
jgi:hypothetical protein